MLLTVHQVAERLTVSVPTVWRFAKTNPDFPKAVKLSPGTTRWRTEDVESWLDSRLVATDA